MSRRLALVAQAQSARTFLFFFPFSWSLGALCLVSSRCLHDECIEHDATRLQTRV